ncbi:daf-12-interacting protein 1-like isoform X2 [Stegostoma tigrinum]|uniref:daf-12-interacting protein 1-like isoform X2 n=1 Tax=Stegostoma tigrinum TaxID=3053191 RepID=UPI00202AF7AD|nr:daf-12-interacting protein 1-like isoform X2 [Stegostoma tigrinum]
MYLKNYRQCPYPAALSSHSQEMELVYRRCLQSDREGHGETGHGESLPLVPDQRPKEKQTPHCKGGSDENGKERSRDIAEKIVRSAMASNQLERKNNCSAHDPVKAAKGKVHQRENRDHPIHERKKLCPPEKTIKCLCDSSHKNQESVPVKPLSSQNTEQDAVPRDSSTLPSSSVTKKEEKSEIHLKKIFTQNVEKNVPGTSSTAQIPVRITPRIDGVGRTSGSFLAPRHNPLKNPAVTKSKTIESRSPELPAKRKKTKQKSTCTIPRKVIHGNTGADEQNQDNRGTKTVREAAFSDDELSDDDIFRELPDRHTEKAKTTREKTNNKFKGEQLSLNAATSRDVHHCQKKHSCKNGGQNKEGSRHPSRDLKSHSASATGCKVSKASKDVSKSDATTEKDRPKNETHKDPRSALILAKRDKLMKTYRLDCEAFAIVAKQLVNQDPTIEKQVQLALRKSLRLIGERCLGELKKSIAKYDAANAAKNSS